MKLRNLVRLEGREQITALRVVAANGKLQSSKN